MSSNNLFKNKVTTNYSVPKKFICGQQYISSPPVVEHSGEGINGCHPCNAKLFKRIEHSGIR